MRIKMTQTRTVTLYMTDPSTRQGRCTTSLLPLPGISRDSSVGITTVYGLEDRMIGIRFRAGTGNLSLRRRVQTGSVAHPASYPVGTGGFSLGIK
jgi:hypothetical protein